MLFNGEYEHTIDSKQRLAVPADIRARMERSGMSAAFYLVPMPDGTIWLWPEATFERLAGALGQSLLPGEDLLEFDSITFPLTRHTTIDSAGRIRLPEDTLAEAGLGSTVMILGMRDHLVLCDPASYRKERAAKRARYADIMRRAHTAMASQQFRAQQSQQQPGMNKPAGGENDAGSSL